MSDITIKNIIIKAHQTALEKGFYDGVDEQDPNFIGTSIALMHQELSEALDELRDGNIKMWLRNVLNSDHKMTKKPEGFLVELADCVIRICDTIGSLGLGPEFEEAIKRKMEYNKNRPYKHGRKNF